jgi:hypothetical protein
VLDRIPDVQPMHLEEAEEYARNPFSADVRYIFKRQDVTEAEPSSAAGTSDPHKKKRKNSHEGKNQPKDSDNIRKYSCYNIPAALLPSVDNLISGNKIFDNNPYLKTECENLIGNALSKRTWQKYNSALNAWKNFCLDTNAGKPTHWNRNTKLAFSCWCTVKRNLTPGTIKAYISALKKIKSIFSPSSKNDNENLLNFVLRGAENLKERKKSPADVPPITLHILETIRNGLKTQKFSKCTKQSIWTACLVAYWGLFRLGEIFPPSPSKFDRFSNLLWSDIDLSKDRAKFCIKSPKTRHPLGKTVTICKVPSKKFCPVSALRKLKKRLKKENLFKTNSPLFYQNNGKAMTKRFFLQGINTSLGGGSFLVIKGKSFRSGIPSNLASFPALFNPESLKFLGRWKGPSYKRYIRDPSPENQWFFHTVAKTLIDDFMRRSEGKAAPEKSQNCEQQR